MRLVNKKVPLTRRTFLGSATGTVMTAGLATKAQAGAPVLKTVASPDSAATLVAMARDIYPHDRIPDLYYATAIEIIDRQLMEAGDTSGLLEKGTALLDTVAQQKFGKRYVDIVAEGDRVQSLKAIEGTPFFAKVRAGMVTAFYNQKVVWTLLGYEGSSFEHGGYLERGFNDLDWLES
jgi:hypothetical protein